MAEEHLFTDAYQPRQIARRVEELGVAKAHADTLSVFVLALLAGAFISLGALFFTVVLSDSNLGFGVTRLLGGLSFSLGLVLVVGAEQRDPTSAYLRATVNGYMAQTRGSVIRSQSGVRRRTSKSCVG